MTDDGLDPVARLGDAPPFDAATDARVRAKVLGLLAEDGVEAPEGFVDDAVVATVGGSTPARQRAGARWGLRLGLAASVAAVVVLVVVGLVATRQEPLPTMADLAAAARSGPYATITDGEVLVVRTESEVVGVSVDTSTKRVRPDGSGTDEVTNSANGTENTVEYGPGEMIVGGMPYLELAELPTDPDGLVDAVIEIGSIDEEYAVWSFLSLLSTTATPPEVRGTAVDVLVEYGGRIEDVDGTPSIVADAPDGVRIVATIDEDLGVVTSLEATGPGVVQRERHLGTSVEPA